MKRSERLGAGELEQQLRWGVRCRGCDWPGLAHFGAGDSIWRISFSVLCFCSFVCYQSSLPWGFSQPQEEEDSVRIEQLHLIPLKRYLKQGQYRVFWGESFPAQHQDWSLYPVARWNREHVWKWFWSATASILSRALLFHNKAIKHPTGWFLHCAVCICRFTEVSFLLGNDYALHMLSGRDFGLLWCWGRFGGTSSAAASNWKEKPSSENTMQRARCDGIVLSIPNTLFRGKNLPWKLAVCLSPWAAFPHLDFVYLRRMRDQEPEPWASVLSDLQAMSKHSWFRREKLVPWMKLFLF